MRFFSAIIVLTAAAAFGAAGPVDTLRFSHKAHIQDIGAKCVDCHESTVKSERPSTGAVVAEAVCKKCHDNATATFECATCHSNSKNVLPRKAIHLKTKFSHKRHLSDSQNCTPCHLGLENIDKASGKNLPTMEVCQTCHDNKKAPSSCAVCHSDLKSIEPSTHNSLWLGRGGHGFQARFSSAQCTGCHTESSCNQCHMGNTPTKIHTPGYEFEHGIDVERKEMDCSVCHQASRFCQRCHEGKR